MSLLNPGPYGVGDDDPKAVLIRDLAKVTSKLSVQPIVIGGIAVIVNGHKRQTVDVDLLVARDDAMKLIRRLQRSKEFSKVRLDRFRHVRTGTILVLCVEGEATTPGRKDRFPSPADVEYIMRDPLPVVALIDLLALKVKSGRAQDEADFVSLFKAWGLSSDHVEKVRKKIEDPKHRDRLDRWHARALEEIERDRLRRRPAL